MLAQLESPQVSSDLLAHKRIRVRTQHPDEAEAIQREFRITPLASRVLAARGHGVNDDLRNYLHPTLRHGLPSPKNLKNIEHACELVADVLQKKVPIAICCD